MYSDYGRRLQSALISNVKMVAITALETYRNRDIAEKTFDNLKDKRNLRSTQKHHDLYIGLGVEPLVPYLKSSL